MRGLFPKCEIGKDLSAKINEDIIWGKLRIRLVFVLLAVALNCLEPGVIERRLSYKMIDQLRLLASYCATIKQYACPPTKIHYLNRQYLRAKLLT